MREIRHEEREYCQMSHIIRVTGSLGRGISHELLGYFGQLFDRLSNVRVTASNYGLAPSLSRWWILQSLPTSHYQNSEACRPRGCSASSVVAPPGRKLQRRQLFARRWRGIFSFKCLTTVFLLSLHLHSHACSNYWRVYVQLCTDYVITCAVSHYCSRPRYAATASIISTNAGLSVRSQACTYVGLLPL